MKIISALIIASTMMVSTGLSTAQHIPADGAGMRSMTVAARACTAVEKQKKCQDIDADCQNGLFKKYGLSGKDIAGQARGARDCRNKNTACRAKACTIG